MGAQSECPHGFSSWRDPCGAAASLPRQGRQSHRGNPGLNPAPFQPPLGKALHHKMEPDNGKAEHLCGVVGCDLS